MSYKYLKSKNCKTVSKLKKFSNLVLFERRENELLKKINSNKLLPIKANKNKVKSDPNNNLSDFALKTISSFKSSFDFLTTQIESFSTKNKNNKTNNNLEIFPYKCSLTEFNTNKKMKNLKRNKVFSTKDIRKHNNKIFSKYLNSIKDMRFNIISNRNSNNNILYIKEKENKIDVLKELEIKNNTKNEKKVNKKIISLFKTKQKKFNIKKYGVNDVINQTHYLMLYKYALNKKKEMSLRIQESYQNDNEYIDDKINSLKLGSNLYDIKFGNKITEYVKYISYYKEEEKKKCDILENNKNEYKKEIMKLQNKIKKQEIEKDTILRWIYFQIKMKEKKLQLPDYYKKIIETNIKRIITRRKTLSINPNNLKMVIDSKKLHHWHHSTLDSKELSSKNLATIQKYDFINNEESHHSKNTNSNNKKHLNYTSYKTKNSSKSIQIKLYNNHTHKTANNNIINFEENNLDNEVLQKIHKNLNESGIDVYEINRITEYKLFLIYQTPEEFLERLKELENENLMLIDQYNSLQKNLIELKKKFNKILKEKSQNNDNFFNIINRIKLKEYELNEEIKRNYLLNIQVSDMKKGKFLTKKNNINNMINQLKNKYKLRNNKNKPSYSSSIGKEVFLRISNLYNLLYKIDDTIEKEENKKSKNKQDIIHMLSYIETNIDILKNKFKVYNNPEYENYEEMKKIKNEIEKRHKIEKGEMLRLQEKEKYLKFQEEIENKMNRIFFIQKRKTNVDNVLNSFGYNYNKNNFKREKNKGQPIFEDFMFENKDYFNFEK